MSWRRSGTVLRVPGADPTVLPMWVQAIATGIQTGGTFGMVAVAIGAQRQQRGADFAGHVEDGTGLTGAELLDRLLASPDISGIVENGLDAAMRSATEEKRWLLARVVCRAFESEDGAVIQELDVLLRAIAALEPYHVEILAKIAKPRPGNGIRFKSAEGALAEEALRIERLEGSHLVGPILAALRNENLIYIAVQGDEGANWWLVTPFGRRLIEYMVGGVQDVPDVKSCEVVGRFEGDAQPGCAVIVRNIGFCEARIHRVVVQRHGESVREWHCEPPLEVGADDETEVGRLEWPDDAGLSLDLAVHWTDAAGAFNERTRLYQRP